MDDALAARQVRIAENQALYRSVNEQLEALNEAFDELPTADCAAAVTILASSEPVAESVRRKSRGRAVGADRARSGDAQSVRPSANGETAKDGCVAVDVQSVGGRLFEVDEAKKEVRDRAMVACKDDVRVWV